jgi:AcrR family transcriptional regulator
MAPSNRLPRAARRAQLIEAAASAFLARGYDKTSMEDVAQAAGVSRLIVYRNFESKEDLYRQILRQLLVDLGEAFSGLSFEDVAARGASTVIMPVARTHPAAFRLLWRDAWHEPPFEDLAEEFRTYVTVYARAILSRFIPDEALLDWAARSAGAHLVDGICNWLDFGDPARDDEVAATMSRGLRALAAAWADLPASAAAR